MRPPPHPPARRAARAFLMMDLLMALAIATAVIVALAVATGSLHRAERRMADSRAANRRLEQGLLTLQSGGTADPCASTWSASAKAPPTRSGSACPSATARPRTPRASAALVGLVPAAKTAGGAP